MLSAVMDSGQPFFALCLRGSVVNVSDHWHRDACCAGDGRVGSTSMKLWRRPCRDVRYMFYGMALTGFRKCNF